MTESHGSDWLLHGSVWLATIDSVTTNRRKGTILTSMIMGCEDLVCSPEDIDELVAPTDNTVDLTVSSFSSPGLVSRRRLFPRIGFEGRALVAVGAPIPRFPFDGIASMRDKSSSCVSESSRGWVGLRCCTGRAFPLDLDAKVVESGISSDSDPSVVPFD